MEDIAKAFEAAYKSGASMMDIKMHTGEALGDCTFEECYAFDGWLRDVGYRLADEGEKAGRVLTVREGFDETAPRGRYEVERSAG